ncbi:Gfo/Idh/MocA family oxidoreductase [Variovorax sp. J22R24]|uniref:Gfo/Idh/MocA family protein n=1 Tax=Variovorax gracilis TaxID=3053502 RepID=UPI0025758C58|nr:Gfo/Idh/MocA family oxidoreductase [Variovorax sp. J22R24]MDM0106587.1 Gfo/Idh/MocA family oxidoreductase [Variovorax sp. J22R24]
MSAKIRVGIIGSGGWARYGHIPALQALEQFEIVALAGRNLTKVQGYAKQFSIQRSFGSAEELIADPDVDLVVVLAPTPEHGRLARAVIAAGKDVYTEWPLSTTTAESEQILTLAKVKGIKHVIGLQRRFSPAHRYWRDLVRQGHVGKIRSVRMSVGVDAFGAVMPEAVKWVLDPANFTYLLPVYGGHFHDVLFQGVGFPEQLAAVMESQFPITTIAETGEKVPSAGANQVMVMGKLSGGGLFTVQLEGGQVNRTGLQIDITGTKGALRITNPRGFQNPEDHAVWAMSDDTGSFKLMPTPAEYMPLPVSHLDASVQDVAYLYAAYARDKRTSSTDAPSFEDAIRQHRLIDEIRQKSEAFGV